MGVSYVQWNVLWLKIWWFLFAFRCGPRSDWTLSIQYVSVSFFCFLSPSPSPSLSVCLSVCVCLSIHPSVCLCLSLSVSVLSLPPPTPTTPHFPVVIPSAIENSSRVLASRHVFTLGDGWEAIPDHHQDLPFLCFFNSLHPAAEHFLTNF